MTCHYLARGAGAIDVANELTHLDGLINSQSDEGARSIGRAQVFAFRLYAQSVYDAYKGYCERGTPSTFNGSGLSAKGDGISSRLAELRNSLEQSGASASVRIGPVLSLGITSAISAMQLHGNSNQWSTLYDFCGKSRGSLNAIQALSGLGSIASMRDQLAEVNLQVTALTPREQASLEHGFPCAGGPPSAGGAITCGDVMNARDVIYACVGLNRGIFFSDAIRSLRSLRTELDGELLLDSGQSHR